MWIFILSRELLALLEGIATMVPVSRAILGILVLAPGNGVGGIAYVLLVAHITRVNFCFGILNTRVCKSCHIGRVLNAFTM